MSARSLLTLTLLVALSTASLDVYYLDHECGGLIDMTDIHSASIETARTLTYPNDMNCVVTFRAPPGQRFYLLLNRFATESSGNRCYDYLSMYDGEGVSSPPIISQLCGEISGETAFNTTGEFVTFKFVSDDSAKDRGFALLAMGFTQGPSCSSDEILCDVEQICIDEVDSLCDDYDHCAGGSDENQCTGEVDFSNETIISSIGLIVGLSIVSLVVVIIIIVLAHYCYKKHKWNQYLKQLYGNKNLVAAEKIEAAYPLTHTYQDKEFINVTRAERDAALVRIDDGGPAANADIPFGGSASLASSVSSVASEKPTLRQSINPDMTTESSDNHSPQEKTTSEPVGVSSEELSDQYRDRDSHNDNNTRDNTETGKHNPAFVSSSEKVTEL